MSDLDNELQKINQNTDLAPTEESPMDLAIKQMNEVSQFVVDNIRDDRDKSDELYDYMKDEIDINNDKNPATREAMAKALDSKMKGTDQMIELLKVKAKLINPQKAGVSVSVNLGNFDDTKGGNTNSMIEIVENIQYEVNEDD